MTHYIVGMVQRSWEETDILVEADSEGEAVSKAEVLAERGECQWRFLETGEDNDRQIVSVRVLS